LTFNLGAQQADADIRMSISFNRWSRSYELSAVSLSSRRSRAGAPGDEHWTSFSRKARYRFSHRPSRDGQSLRRREIFAGVAYQNLNLNGLARSKHARVPLAQDKGVLGDVVANCDVRFEPAARSMPRSVSPTLTCKQMLDAQKAKPAGIVRGHLVMNVPDAENSPSTDEPRTIPAALAFCAFEHLLHVKLVKLIEALNGAAGSKRTSAVATTSPRSLYS